MFSYRVPRYLLVLLLGLLNIPQQISCSSHLFDLQNAINTAEPGSKIKIPKGKFIGQFTINKTLILEGSVNENGEILTVLSGNYAGSVLTITADSVSLRQLIIQNGSSRIGGGIHNTGSNTHIHNCQIIENEAISGNLALPTSLGGGIFTNQNMKISHSLIADNTVYGLGGGLYLTDSEVIIDNDCKIYHNKAFWFGSVIAYGAGLFISNAKLNLLNSEVKNNQTFGNGNGGGLFNSNGMLNIINTRVENNIPDNIVSP